MARVVQYEFDSLESDGRAEVAALRRRMQGRVADQIRRAVDTGTADVPDVAGTARACMSLCIDVCRWYDPDGPQSPAQVGDLYRHLVRCWLLPPTDEARA